MTPKLLQLYAIRSQIEALILVEEQQIPQFTKEGAFAVGVETVPAEEWKCPHPEDKRRQAHNMGEEPYYICLACNEKVEGFV